MEIKLNTDKKTISVPNEYLTFLPYLKSCSSLDLNEELWRKLEEAIIYWSKQDYNANKKNIDKAILHYKESDDEYSTWIEKYSKDLKTDHILDLVTTSEKIKFDVLTKILCACIATIIANTK